MSELIKPAHRDAIKQVGVLSNKRLKCPTLGARSARFHIRVLAPDLKKLGLLYPIQRCKAITNVYGSLKR